MMIKIAKYLIALASLGMAYSLTLFTSYFDQTPIVLPFAVIIFSILYLGLGPSTVVLVITIFAHDYFILGPGALFDFSEHHFIEALIFLAVTMAIYSAVVAKEQAEERLLHQSNHDPLTNLPNRRLLQYQLAQVYQMAKRRNKRFAVLSVDLDKFKEINDKLGHERGDLLLQKVALRLQSCIRAEDIAARVGGDEFIVLLSEIKTVKDASRVASKIRRSMARKFRIGKIFLGITSSIGVAFYPTHGKTVPELLRNADAAMYHAKVSGRNNQKVFKHSLVIS